MGELIFILGPARSGKSRLAERLAAVGGGQVLYIATLEAKDEEMARRREVHRAARPPHWQTLEEPLRVVQRLRLCPAFDTYLLDCLTLWVSNLLIAASPDGGAGLEDAGAAIRAAVADLLSWQEEGDRRLIVVSNEVGAGLVPEYPLGRAFRDLLGEANEAVARAAHRFYYAIAGHFLDVKGLSARASDDV